MSKYKVLGFMPLHYGSDFMRESLLSIRDFVDKMFICYSVLPSQGHGTDHPNPDKEEDLRKIAEEVLGDKLIWETRPSFDFEGKHRNERYRYSENYDIIFSLDADEVLESADVPAALDYCMNSPARYMGIDGFVHFWRSLSWHFTDHFKPVRLERVKANNEDQDHGCRMRVYHFSYAQRAEILEYKMKVSGHLDEFKPNYLQEKWYAWTPDKAEEILYLHPTSNGIWGRAFPFDKNSLPEILKQHKYFNVEVIQ